MLTLLTLALLLASSPDAAASLHSRSDAQAVRPQPPVTPRTPARDNATPAARGTAVIKGRVVSADGGRPLRRAQIRVSGAELPEALATSTNAQGLFEVRGLPAGRFTIRVQRSGYLPIEYGQRRPGERGRPLQVADKEIVEDVNVLLPRAGVISGMITDETGDPVAGVSVYAMRPQFFLGRRHLVPVGPSSRTDDTGQYRLLSLLPGEYVLMGILRETWRTRDDNPQVLGYAPSYYPGTANAPDAQRVKVSLGQEVSAVDFSLVPGRVATVAGTAMRADGTPLAGGTVSLSQEIRGPLASSFSSAGGTKVGADGRFAIHDVSPGEYRLSASGSNAGGPPDETSMLIVVQGVDLELALMAGAPATLRGHVVTNTGQPLPASSSPPRVYGERLIDDRSGGLRSDDPNGLVGADGAFTLEGLTGAVVLKVWSLPRGWTIDRIELGGRDYAEMPLEIPAGQEIAGAKIVVTNSFPTLTGRVVDDAGEPAEGTVILFPSDASQWVEAAGRVLSARPDQSSTFRFESVRPGDYLIAALDYVPAWQVGDPEFLAQLRERATTLTIGRGELAPITVTLRK